MTLSTQVLVGLALGVLTGLFFGEIVRPLHVVGDAYVQLMQMTVLPYIAVSLITGLGSLSREHAALLARRGGLLLLAFWLMALVTVFLMGFGFPDWESSSFFSTSLVEERKSIDLLTLYIPANPFRSLADGAVPAVVLFSMACGVALMAVDDKERLLRPLSAFQDVLTSVAQTVVRLSPLGIFAITAHAAGTMSTEHFSRLEVYFLVYLVAWAVLTFWAVPALVSTLTPLKFRQVLASSRDVLVTAFATQNLFIVLPLMAERTKELLEKAGQGSEETNAFVDVTIPVAFTFPGVGVLLTLSFVPFAAWFSGSELAASQYPAFLGTGLLTFFGNAWVAIPFLLDMFRIPIDLFQLFVAADVLIAPFGTLLAAIQTIVLTLLATCAVRGTLRLRRAALLRYAAVGVGLLVLGLVGVRTLLELGVSQVYTADEALREMRLPGDSIAATVHSTPPPKPSVLSRLPFLRHEKTGLERIRDRGAIRVAYVDDALPFAYVNARGELVGFDIDMAHELARELDVKLEFYRVHREQLADVLNRGYCDIAMTGLAITTGRAEKVSFSIPYLETTLGFVVRDDRRQEFGSREALQAHAKLELGILDIPYYRALVEKLVPRAKLVTLDSMRDFFEKRGDTLDGLVHTAEVGAAWSLLYPSYTAAVPRPNAVKVPLAYAMAQDDPRMVSLVDSWIALKKRDRTLGAAFDYWILGKGAEKKSPRWSVVRDVLHWVD